VDVLIRIVKQHHYRSDNAFHAVLTSRQTRASDPKIKWDLRTASTASSRFNAGLSNHWDSKKQE
jgi:exoribonuclease II